MILLRHGQSEFNLHFDATGQDPGIPDAPLTRLGHRQAEAAAAALTGEGVQRIFCSPYTRALQTALHIARRLELPVTVTPAVRERFSSSCDIGTPPMKLALAWPDLDFGVLDEVWWPVVEEPHDQIAARAALFRAQVEALPDSVHTLVVCHWGFIMAMTGQSLMNGQWLRCTTFRGRYPMDAGS